MSEEFDAFVGELMQPLGGVVRRRMFGGTGLWRDGVMFAIIVGDTLYLKTDSATEAAFRTEGSEPFSYATRTGRTTIATLWRAPDRLYDDEDAFLAFARDAVDAAVRSAARKAASPARSKKRTG